MGNPKTPEPLSPYQAPQSELTPTPTPDSPGTQTRWKIQDGKVWVQDAARLPKLCPFSEGPSELKLRSGELKRAPGPIGNSLHWIGTASAIFAIYQGQLLIAVGLIIFSVVAPILPGMRSKKCFLLYHYNPKARPFSSGTLGLGILLGALLLAGTIALNIYYPDQLGGLTSAAGAGLGVFILSYFQAPQLTTLRHRDGWYELKGPKPHFIAALRNLKNSPPPEN